LTKYCRHAYRAEAGENFTLVLRFDPELCAGRAVRAGLRFDNLKEHL
jgi:hypothetical protein